MQSRRPQILHSISADIPVKVSMIPLKTAGIIILILLISSVSKSISSNNASGCYKSIVSFGDSLADTGNLLLLNSSNMLPDSARPPYGSTFFHRQTGRFSDGRLVIDFIAESLGLPLLQPYVGGRDSNFGGGGFESGVNFAVAGATALDFRRLEKQGIVNPMTNVSLEIELDWFKQFLGTIPVPDRGSFLRSSLVMVGEIGGNDYNYHLLHQIKSPEEVNKHLVPLVVSTIGHTIEELIKLGVQTMLVPGNLPNGCLPCYLTHFITPDKTDYDPKTGCINWLNEFSEFHNKLLQEELRRIQTLHPRVTITYFDYYNSVMRLYLSPNEFGFSKEKILQACCGAGGPYNFDELVKCRLPKATSCSDPSSFASFDGVHFTEAAYRVIAQSLLEGNYTFPPLSFICSSVSTSVFKY